LIEPNSPGEKAGLKTGDTVVTFDGEHVRSVRQFTRLVEEARPGTAVDASILRDGETVDVRITPTNDRRADWLVDGDGLRARFGELNNRIRSFSLDVDPSGPQLGVTVRELLPQSAAYFGAESGGVLVAGVTDASPAARAGIKAGDVITSFAGDAVRSRLGLARAVSSASTRSPGDVSIGVVRDKKARTLRVRLDPVDKRL
jgi:serine protease Do